MMQRVEDLLLDGTGHTLHNGCVLSVPTHMFATANSKFVWFDHPKQTESRDTHGGKQSFGYSQDGPGVEINISFACNSIPRSKYNQSKSKFTC